MKKIITTFAIILLIFSFTVCYATEIILDEEYTEDLNTAVNERITVKVNGDDLKFTKDPIIKDGIILVSILKMCESIGFEAIWDNSTKKLQLLNGDMIITLYIGGSKATIQDENGYYYEKELNSLPQIINNTTFVPVRFICEAIGAEITWDQLSKTVDIKYGTLFSVSIDDTVITLNDGVDSVLESLGKPDRIDKDITKLDWYVYSKDYKKFIMVGMLNDKVASIYTSNTNFYINDEIKYGVKKEKLPELGQIQYEIDYIDGEILCGVMVSSKNIREFWEPAEDGNVRAEIIELQALDCLNAFRVQKGLNSLEIDKIAQKTAREHSKDMAENDYLAHKGLDGRMPLERYRENNGKRGYGGENLAGGPNTGMEQVNGLLNSIGHRNNMLFKHTKYVGIGVFYDKDARYRYYSTHLFAY